MRLTTLVAALSLASSAAFAGGIGPLPAGAPAGVKKAQVTSQTAIIILAGIGVVAGVAIAASGGGGGSPAVTPPTISTTTTTG